MRSYPLAKLFLGAYLLVFFGYLLGPLFIMGITAFNSPGFPKASPWECLTFEWFDVLANDQRIVNSLYNSAIVGGGTVVLSLVIGLAGALVLTQIWPRLRATYYTMVIAPILIPGVVLGISTLVFWGRINTLLGFPDDGFLRNGIFLTILGQTTFIASYCMLVFIARLARFDPGLMEAALDLGATHAQAFRKILLPFLKPAFGSAAVIAFLASFENYNTTTFTFGTFPTLTIELAQKVRYGINPSISALAVIIVTLTVIGALVHEIYQRRQQLATVEGATMAQAAAQTGGAGSMLPGFLRGNPAALVLILLSLGILSTVWTSQVYSPDACKAEVREQKRIETQKRIDALKAQQLQRQQEKAQQGPDIFGADKSKVKPSTETAPTTKSPGSKTFGDVFNPGNLDNAGDGAKPDAAPGPGAANPGKGTFGDVFNPGNLGTPDEGAKPDATPGPGAANPGKGTFGNVFNPGNLSGGADKDN